MRYIPRAISKVAEGHGMGVESAYNKIFNEHINNINQFSYYSQDDNIVEYLWDKYIKLCMEVPTVVIESRKLGYSTLGSNLPMRRKIISFDEVIDLAKGMKNAGINEINRQVEEIIGKAKKKSHILRLG
jgi:hypothetical protein